jgi:hypothetical protein
LQITPVKIFVAVALFNLLVAGWMLFDSLRNDRVRLREGPVYRDERPRIFWFLVGIGLCLLVFYSVMLILLLKL